LKAASAGLITLLATGKQFAMSDLYTFTLADTSLLRYTSANADEVVSGHTFSALGPKVKRGATRTVIGVEVDTLNLTLQVNQTKTQGGVPLAQFALNGGFDGARLKLERSFASAWGVAPAGTLTLFCGRVSDIDISGTEIAMQVKSDLELLNVQVPRNVFMASCIHSLYDSGCGLAAGAFTVTGNTTANSTKTSIHCNLTNPTGYFDLGTVRFTTGQCAGVERTVKRHTTGVLVPSFPLPYVPAAGDLFETKPGCDKLQATCNAKFSNQGNFRGFPYIPTPESSY
jgi:uncharacterized phage protein (TIGR02218 family)